MARRTIKAKPQGKNWNSKQHPFGSLPKQEPPRKGNPITVKSNRKSSIGQKASDD